MSEDPNTTDPAAQWNPSAEELERMDTRDRDYRRQNALNAAARVAAPGTPAERVLATAAAFYDYLATDVPPVVEPEPE